jgi:post-segregation antitoxin (ccd killing protein)
MSQKVRTTVYLNETAKKRLKANGINLSRFLNNKLCKKAEELGAEEVELENEVEKLEEKLEHKKEALEQVKKEMNKLEDFLTEPRVHGNSHLGYYDQKRNNGWSEDRKEEYIKKTAEKAPINISPNELQNKMEAMLYD